MHSFLIGQLAPAGDQTLVRVVAAILLSLPAWPLVRLFRITNLWRAFPLPAFGLLAFVVVYAGTACWAAIILPAGVLAVAAALVTAGFAFATWRALPSYGRARGLPPGSLSFVATLAAIFDQQYYEKQARKHGPVFKMMQFMRPAVCVVGLKKGLELITRGDDVIAPAPQPITDAIPGGFLRYMKPAVHAKYASKFRAAFSPDLVGGCEPAMRQIIRTQLERMAADCKHRGAAVSPVAYLERASAFCLGRMMFGFSDDPDGSLPDFERAWRSLEKFSVARPPGKGLMDALEKMRALLVRQVRKLEEGHTLPFCMLTECARAGVDLSDRTLLDNLIIIFRIPSANISGLLRWMVKMLADHPQWAARVCEPTQNTSANAAEHIVLETLRLQQSEYIYRNVVGPLEFEGYRIPPGWRLRVCVHESHRDPDVFRDPDAFRPERFAERNFSSAEFSPFGWGRHECLGAEVTLAIGRIFVEELCRGFEWQLTADGPHERGARHFMHWQPSSKLRLMLSARTAKPTSAAAAIRDSKSRLRG